MKISIKKMFMILSVSMFLASCDDGEDSIMNQPGIITIENVLNGKSWVPSGTFQGLGAPPVILPGQSVSFSFYAGKKQSLTFAIMYGRSDLFFAPANPGIKLYSAKGIHTLPAISNIIKAGISKNT